MVYAAFNSKSIKVLGKDLLKFYMTSLVFGGAATALIHFIKPSLAQKQNGV